MAKLVGPIGALMDWGINNCSVEERGGVINCDCCGLMKE